MGPARLAMSRAPSGPYRARAALVIAAGLAALAVPACGGSPAPAPRRQVFVPRQMAGPSRALQYSQAVRVGNTIWVSGQVGIDQAGVAEGLEAQARLAFRNLKLTLETAGATLEDVVELVTYHRDMNELITFARVKAEFFTGGEFPAWTPVGVTALPHPALLVEIRATAVAGSGRASPAR